MCGLIQIMLKLKKVVHVGESRSSTMGGKEASLSIEETK